MNTVDQVRARYAAAARAVLDRPDTAEAAAGCCDDACCSVAAPEGVAQVAQWYDDADLAALPEAAVLAGLGCGNPLTVADLRPGERVLDLGSGGGIDVLLSARRVGPTGFAYGVDMTAEMLELARRNAADAANVEFLEGRIESVPLPDGAVDVIISNCVVNLAVDKALVFADMYRLLVPGGRIGLTDMVAEDRLSAADRATLGDHAGCIAGALSRSEYLAGLAAAGFTQIEVRFLDDSPTGLHSANVRAVRP